MENNIKVSVIIPVYNVEKYLDGSLASVTNQLFSDYEILIINDGSTDDSASIIEKYKRAHKNIKVIHQTNNGQGNARNKGIKIAKGDYIYFFDSDDLLSEDALNIMYEEAIKNKLDLLMFNGDYFFDNDYDLENVKFNYKRTGTYKKVLSGKNAFIKLINNKEFFASPCLYFIKKETIENNNIIFHEDIIHEDVLFLFQVIFKTERVKVIKNELFYRRVRKGSTITSSNYLESFNGNYEVLKNVMRIKNEVNESNKKLLDAITIQVTSIYGNILKSYILMTKNEQKQIKNKLNMLKKLGRENHFFGRIDFLIFSLSKSIYSILRKIYESL